MIQRAILFLLLVTSAPPALAWGDVSVGLGAGQEKGTQAELDLNFSPQGWWAVGAHTRCSLGGDCGIEARIRASLEVFRTVPRLRLGYGTSGLVTSLAFDRFLSRRSSLRGALGWRSQGGFFGTVGLGIFPFD